MSDGRSDIAGSKTEDDGVKRKEKEKEEEDAAEWMLTDQFKGPDDRKTGDEVEDGVKEENQMFMTLDHCHGNGENRK